MRRRSSRLVLSRNCLLLLTARRHACLRASQPARQPACCRHHHRGCCRFLGERASEPAMERLRCSFDDLGNSTKMKKRRRRRPRRLPRLRQQQKKRTTKWKKDTANQAADPRSVGLPACSLPAGECRWSFPTASAAASVLASAVASETAFAAATRGGKFIV